MNHRVILGALVIAVGVGLKFPLNILQVFAGLLLFARGIITAAKDKS